MAEPEGSSATTEGAKAQDKLEQPSKPWHSYISEELPRSLMDSRDSAIRSARSLHQNSYTHLSSLQDFMLDMRSKYAVYEDAFFTKVKDGVTIARQHPTITAGLGLSAAFLLMRGPRRFLFRHTLGRLQSEEARFVKAEKNVNMLSLSVDLMKKESKKLLQRADFAEKEMINGRTELLNAGKNLQTLAKSVDKVEAQAAGRLVNSGEKENMGFAYSCSEASRSDLMDLLREIPGREALRLRAEVASVASLLRQQKSSMTKRMMKLSDLGVPV